MKILRRPNTEWKMQHTCEHCEAELEVEKADVKWQHYSGDQREPSYDSYEAICAVCGNPFAIQEKSMTKAVKLEIQRRIRLEDRS
jgi:transcription elongation factor Elf1